MPEITEFPIETVPITDAAGFEQTVNQTINNNTINNTVTGGNYASAAALTAGAADIDDIITYFATSDLPVILDTDIDVPSPKVFPDNASFKPGEGKFVKSGTGTLDFEGNAAKNIPLEQAIFEGFGVDEVVFSGTDYPKHISSAWWDTGNTSVSDRLNRADASVVGKRCKISAFEGVIDDDFVLTTNHHLHFEDGEFTNTYNGTGGAPFVLESYTRVTGSPNAKLYESPTDNKNQMFYAYHMSNQPGNDWYGLNYNIYIEKLNIYGDPAQTGGSGIASTILLGNTINGAVRDCYFYRTHGYTIGIGGFGSNGNYAKNVFADRNIFYGIGTQAAVIFNAKNSGYRHNLFDQTLSNLHTTYAVLDVEPNTNDAVLENIFIEDNIFDFTKEVQFTNPTAITVASATDVNTTTNEITENNHVFQTGYPLDYTAGAGAIGGLTTATRYWVIKTGTNTFKLAASQWDAIAETPVPIDLSSTGTGTQTFTPFQKYGAAMTIQGFGFCNSLFVSRNRVLGRPMTNSDYSGPLTAGLIANGFREVVVEDNYVRGAFQAAFSIYNCRYLRFRNNEVTLSTEVAGVNAAAHLVSIADGSIVGNEFTESFVPSSQVSGIYESELEFLASSSSTVLTNLGDGTGNRFGDFWGGSLQFVYNGSTYTSNAADVDAQTVTMTASVGTVAAITFQAADVNAGTNNVNKAAHGFATGARVRLSNSGGALPAHTQPSADPLSGFRTYYIIRVDADNLKFASSLANALSNTPIDLTDTGSGTSTITPVLLTKFSNNKYADNDCPDGIRLDPNSNNSRILSRRVDGKITAVSDADYTITHNDGIIAYDSLTTARTVNLYSAVSREGAEHTIVDNAIAAELANITIDPNGSETIGGQSSLVIGVNGGNARIKAHNGNWMVLSSHTDVPTNPAFTPADLGNIIHRWKASDLALSDNDPVATWADSIGSADFTATSGEEPTYKANAGDPYVQGDGTDDFMTATISSLTDFIVFAIWERVTTATYARLFDSTNNTLRIVQNGSADSQQLFPAGGSPATAATPAAPTGFLAMIASRIGSDGVIRINGTAGSQTVATTASGTTLYLLSNSGGTENGNLRIKEIFICDAEFAANEFTWLKQYTLREYGLTL